MSLDGDLLDAAEVGETDRVAELLERQADINSRNEVRLDCERQDSSHSRNFVF